VSLGLSSGPFGYRDIKVQSSMIVREEHGELLFLVKVCKEATLQIRHFSHSGSACGDTSIITEQARRKSYVRSNHVRYRRAQ